MPEVNGPWYNLQETCDKLALSQNELEILLEEGKIKAALRCSNISMLAISKEADKWVGHAAFDYRGHISLSSSNLLSLLDRKGAILSGVSGLILTPARIKSWVVKYPYKSALPNSCLVDWQPIEFDEADFNTVLAVPFVVEGADTLASAESIFSGFMKARKGKMETEADADLAFADVEVKYQFDYQQNASFSYDDIYISGVEIDGYLQAAESVEASVSAVVAYSSSHKDGKRTNLLHELFLKIMRENTGIKARALWQLLRDDDVVISPRYDKDCIIRSINASELTWESTHENTQYYQYKSLSSRMSKLKQRL